METAHIFISHASEDKNAFVRPLAHALKSHGLRLWYDEFSLKPGDSLRRSIDRGLAECSVGLLVLSPSFFEKEWPQRELDGLFSAEIAGNSQLIPIWYNIDFKGVVKRSPLLADRIALNAELGIEELAKRITELYPPAPEAKVANSDLAQCLENLKSWGTFSGEALVAGCWYRFLQINAFKEDYQWFFDTLTNPLSEEQVEQWPDYLDEKLKVEEERLRVKHRLSPDIYLTTDEPIHESELSWWKQALSLWASGTMTPAECVELVRQLDLREFDEYYVLLNVPNFQIPSMPRDLLEEALIEVGSGFENEWRNLDEVCKQLRAIHQNY